ncbi:YqeG family HAD IIIA-type phosphatase [Facklamia sp. DSM 111018]|uniref:YqeG family HAD IIIA-type phosphatase n=1 Tax=Facklamia lactis TaxID=2749967 RepID=A0ABS0LRE5_9LACT|nr:YqeG family HAD IIIA-type phosphatase [Facklamia lactis]MBG9980911.1 YqeG family HAD IIIA-type phosphatase [Facklamia lactis]MBG9986726.1 YqeG family HAD IIIA-type phosphatase [Facklamia lactis]
MKKFLTPTYLINSIYLIHPEDLKRRNIKGMIVDLDNTLIAWDQLDHTKELENWAQEFIQAGIQIFILSNNYNHRVERVVEPLDIPYKAGAFKPSRRNFKLAMEYMELERDEVVVIGDQIMTDVIGAKRLGLKVILVKPIVEHDSIYTIINRNIEKIALKIIGIDRKSDWGESIESRNR